MAERYYHGHPESCELEVEVLEARDGAILVRQSPFFPGGGGQLADRGVIACSAGELTVTGVDYDVRGVWHRFAEPVEPHGIVLLKVDRNFRSLMCELHTLAHIVNTIVFHDFGGALLTGAQLGSDASFRLDFDLPGASNDRLRALAGPINDVIRQDLRIATSAMNWTTAEAEPGLFRSKAVTPPPQEDGTVRIVAIGDLDRQACGGTHLRSTREARPVNILKIENKGRQNRRMRIGLVGPAAEA